MITKKYSFLTIVLILLFLSGCGPQDTETQPAADLPEEITIAYVAMNVNAASPQAMVGKEQGIFEEYLSEHNVRVNWIITSGRDNTAPLMAEDKVDFIYIPINNFSVYSSELSSFGGGDNFRLIAGSTERREGHVMVVREGINSLDDLDGKVVGIANDSFGTELAFYQHLKRETDLLPDSVGGTVEIKFQDYISLLNEGFNDGEYDAIITRGGLVNQALEENENSQKIEISGMELEPFIGLVARKYIIDNFPELTKSVLRAHIKASEEALTKTPEYLAEKQIEDYEYYLKEVLGAIDYELPSEERVARTWTTVDIVSSPNFDYLEELIDYMQRGGYYQGKDLDNFVDLRLLNEIP
ncbi:ABC transporter substrate-binding protein [Dethiobacter alkaliphilus]|uniref:ABC transporter substrate-binding protein n=1 Tax=Dethiobacter alkaliphilus TaxID=427926 RepID=UPI0022273719|nr:hypothetical protein [Dethiobacter alkaliphilus]MCW3491156.1 hypothetical protein [Dethiobacter alkaliphilus]